MSVENLTIGFGSNPQSVVRGMSFNVFPNRTIALVGESGSGKSLTSLAIMGLLPANGQLRDGKITFFEPDHTTVLSNLNESLYQNWRGQKMSMVFQEPMTALNPSLTCGKQVQEVLEQHSKVSSAEAKKAVLEVFEKVKLPNPAQSFKKYPHELSGGQRQRVVIAMAIICKPKLLIADEPTTALDVTVQKEILKLLKELQQEQGMGLLFITHDLGVVSEIADDIVVLYRGDVVEQGSAKHILLDPDQPYTQGLIASRPPESGRPKVLPTISDFLTGQKLSAAQRETMTLHSEQQPLLEVNDLKVQYLVNRGGFGSPPHNFVALKGVSLSVYKGQTVGLVGESGCGKSTLGRSIIGLTSPSEGEVLFKGIDLLLLDKKQKRELTSSIQLIFQDPFSSLNPKQTVGDLLMEPMKVHKMHTPSTRKSKVEELLVRVGLAASDYLKYPHEFSGGQRQRIGIARALTVHPELIICDESVSALDVSVQAQVINLLNDLKEEFEFSYIFISHDLSVVRYMSDEIAVMQAGEIVERGSADQVYHHPNQAYTKKLISSITKFKL